MTVPKPITLLKRESSSPKNGNYVTVHVTDQGYVAKAYVQRDYQERIDNLDVREEHVETHTHKRESSSPKNALMVSAHVGTLDTSPLPVELYMSRIDVCENTIGTQHDRGGM